MAKRRTDAERRARQCERLSRLLRVLYLISGSGRWDAEALAKELECSTRTIHRMLQTLSMAGVPWYFDTERQAYRVRAGFRLAVLHVPEAERTSGPTTLSGEIISTSRQLLDEAERFAALLRAFCSVHESPSAAVSREASGRQKKGRPTT